MAVADQILTDRYALYNGDSCEVLPTLPDGSVHLSVYSPPFCGLYHYSSSERDLSNCRTYDEFFDHYGFIVRELHRVTMPGRVSAVHCMDVPGNGANLGGDTIDLPGDIIRLHKQAGWRFSCRFLIWKEPLAVRNRTMAKALAHKQVVDDSALVECAAADQLLIFRKPGENPVPVVHPVGLTRYIGTRQVPADLLKYRGHKGKQTGNKYSHWVWRQYASAFWDDIKGNQGDPRIDKGGVLAYETARDAEDERHLHPLQIQVIERAVVLYTNPGETVLTPFMGVGSEVYGAVINGRRGVGIELKPSYFRQAVKNLKAAEDAPPPEDQRSMFDHLEPSEPVEA